MWDGQSFQRRVKMGGYRHSWSTEAAVADCTGCAGILSSFWGLCCTRKRCLANCVPFLDHEDLHQLVLESVPSSLSNAYVLLMTYFGGISLVSPISFPSPSTGELGSSPENNWARLSIKRLEASPSHRCPWNDTKGPLRVRFTERKQEECRLSV